MGPTACENRLLEAEKVSKRLETWRFGGRSDHLALPQGLGHVAEVPKAHAEAFQLQHAGHIVGAEVQGQHGAAGPHQAHLGPTGAPEADAIRVPRGQQLVPHRGAAHQAAGAGLEAMAPQAAQPLQELAPLHGAPRVHQALRLEVLCQAPERRPEAAVGPQVQQQHHLRQEQRGQRPQRHLHGLRTGRGKPAHLRLAVPEHRGAIEDAPHAVPATGWASKPPHGLSWIPPPYNKLQEVNCQLCQVQPEQPR